jgi:RNA polymerase sigma-70 factor (ECF subfamily)
MGRDRDSRRLEDLFSQHEQELGRFIAQLVHSRQLADDLVQETFLAAWQSRGGLDGMPRSAGMLYGIARNRVLMYLAAGAGRSRRTSDSPSGTCPCRTRPTRTPSATLARARQRRSAP